MVEHERAGVRVQHSGAADHLEGAVELHARRVREEARREAATHHLLTGRLIMTICEFPESYTSHGGRMIVKVLPKRRGLN